MITEFFKADCLQLSISAERGAVHGSPGDAAFYGAF
jgi:hypothetical protein